jgi:hypothetical protein
VYIETRAIGGRAELVPRFEVPLPRGVDQSTPLRLRDLIALTVRAERDAAEQRREARTTEAVLTQRDLRSGTRTGAIRAGVRAGAAAPPVDQAIATALQAFADGLFLVALDGQQITDLDTQISPQPSSTVTYLRLVALAGG